MITEGDRRNGTVTAPQGAKIKVHISINDTPQHNLIIYERQFTNTGNTEMIVLDLNKTVAKDLLDLGNEMDTRL